MTGIAIDDLEAAYQEALAIADRTRAPDPHRSGLRAVAAKVVDELRKSGRLIPEMPDDVFMVIADDRASVHGGEGRKWDVIVAFRDGINGRRPRVIHEQFGVALTDAINKGQAREWKPPEPKREKTPRRRG